MIVSACYGLVLFMIFTIIFIHIKNTKIAMLLAILVFLFQFISVWRFVTYENEN